LPISGIADRHGLLGRPGEGLVNMIAMRERRADRPTVAQEQPILLSGDSPPPIERFPQTHVAVEDDVRLQPGELRDQGGEEGDPFDVITVVQDQLPDHSGQEFFAVQIPERLLVRRRGPTPFE